jgi:hypothetical protein
MRIRLLTQVMDDKKGPSADDNSRFCMITRTPH